jgi:branched-chain amino acid transport system ATP-binding protein
MSTMTAPQGAPAAATDYPALDVQNVEIRYGGVAAVRGVSLRLATGESVALLGPNGAGKTSLLRCVSGAVPLAGGRIRVGGVDVTGKRPDQILRRGLAHVLEGRQLFATMSVEENLRLGATVRRDMQRVAEDLQRLYETFPDLASKRRQLAMFLSGGQQQMVAIGRALMGRPNVLLLDEPSLGLSPVMLEAVADIVSWAHEQLGTTILVVEQHTALGLAMTSRAYVMVRGTIVLEAPSAALLDGTLLREAYLGAGTVAEVLP